MPVLPEHFLTPEELTEILRLPSVETVYAWRKKRTGPPGFRAGKHLRYDPDAVRVWINQQMTQAA